MGSMGRKKDILRRRVHEPQGEYTKAERRRNCVARMAAQLSGIIQHIRCGPTPRIGMCRRVSQWRTQEGASNLPATGSGSAKGVRAVGAAGKAVAPSGVPLGSPCHQLTGSRRGVHRSEGERSEEKEKGGRREEERDGESGPIERRGVMVTHLMLGPRRQWGREERSAGELAQRGSESLGAGATAGGCGGEGAQPHDSLCVYIWRKCTVSHEPSTSRVLPPPPVTSFAHRS